MAEADPTIVAADDLAALRPANRWRRRAIMFAVPLLVAIAGLYMWLSSGRYVSTDNAYVQQDMVSVSPDVTGRIVSVMVRENQRVKAGDILFRIDPEPYRVTLAQADAALALARVQVSTLETDVGGAAVDISSAQEAIAFAQKTYDRQAELMRSGFTTRARFDEAAHALAQSRETLRTAQTDAARARATLGSGGGTGQPAAIQAALAQRAKAALDLERTDVRAPSDGVVSQSDRVQVGQILIVGVPALSIVAGHGAWIEANFKETDLAKMAIGQRAEATLDAYPGLRLAGHVIGIGAGTGSEFALIPAQNANGNWVKVTQRVPVRIAIDRPSPRPLIAGLSADIRIDTKPGGNDE